MRAAMLYEINTPLRIENIDIPKPQRNEVLIKVKACAVCRTDLHVWAGELPETHLPIILGHQVVGEIVEQGKEADRFPIGTRVGAPWLAKTCQHCSYCLEQKENLCDYAQYRGYQINGGFAEYCLADPNYIYSIPDSYSDIDAAPLLCGGLIGFRAWRQLEQAKRIGFYGFGSAAHILIQVAVHQGQQVYAFTKPNDLKGQQFAKQLGAVWAGGSDQKPPEELDGVIIFAPVGSLIPAALKVVKKSGVVISAGIHMSEIPAFSYDLLYGERVIRSITNLTREDGTRFFELAKQFKIQTHVTTYPLDQTMQALNDLREGKLMGSAVILL